MELWERQNDKRGKKLKTRVKLSNELHVRGTITLHRGFVALDAPYKEIILMTCLFFTFPSIIVEKLVFKYYYLDQI